MTLLLKLFHYLFSRPSSHPNLIQLGNEEYEQELKRREGIAP